ncbi:MAG: glycosyltransferase [Candidatus Latescibacteria bacterium]|nr:glycosyltransferase [Candidatus Latescibacterota bacterium]
MKTVGHCATPYLHANGSWVHSQLSRLQRYRPVVLTQEEENLDQFPVGRLYTARAYPLWQRAGNRLWLKLTGEYPYYARLLRQEGACLIHAHFGYQGCRCLRARRTSGLPMLTTFYGADATQYARLPYWRAFYQRLFAAGEAFLAEGSALAGCLEEAGCPPEKIRLHHLGVDLDRIPFAEGRRGEVVRFLICAPFREKKGIPDALRALGLARRRRAFPCEVVLIGEGPEKAKILAAIGEAGLEGLVVMRGALPYARVIEELGRADLLLQTSRRASDGDTEGGAPVILLDAQAAGLPVVATRHADIPEYVREGESGLLAAEGDIEGLAECILQLVEAPERWAGMGRAGRQHVQEHYNAATQAARLEELYDEFT